MKPIYIIPLLLILLLSCSNESGTMNEIKKIHFGENNFSLFDSLEFRFVALETDSNCLIGSINRIEIFDNRIFVHDLFHAKSIFVFDAEGRFITQVGSIGDGPGNYIAANGFEIDRDNRRIIVNDSNRERLVFYDADTYEYIMHRSCAVSYFRTHRFLSVAENTYNVNSRVFTYHYLQPYIYEITDNDCKLHTMLSFEGLAFPALPGSSSEQERSQYMEELDNSQKKIAAYGIFESNDILFIQLIIGKLPYFAIQNKTTNMSSVFDGRHYVNSMSLDAAVFPVGATGEEIVCMITTGQEINRKKIREPAFAEIVDSMKEDDNPVLCFFKWK
ncbi:MAG: 6-bladed beta-propeller [Tannerella sp.]|jgi:hypothetical protein|nr:6-bladed beta-propeller [Tannerella sp.]